MNKRKKGLCQLLACVMVLVMLVSLSPVNVQAASKVKINKTKATMYVGTPKTLKITGTTKKVTKEKRVCVNYLPVLWCL